MSSPNHWAAREEAPDSVFTKEEGKTLYKSSPNPREMDEREQRGMVTLPEAQSRIHARGSRDRGKVLVNDTPDRTHLSI